MNKLYGVSLHEIKDIYRHCGSIRKTAKTLEVSHTALREYCLSRGLDLATVDKGFTIIHDPLYDKSERNRKSKVTKYFLENEDKPIPRDIRELSNVIGVSYATVQSWLYRRKRLLSDQLVNLPDIRDLDIILIDDYGETHKAKDIRTYKYLIDPYKMTVILRFFLYPKKMVDGTIIPDTMERTLKLDDPKQFMKDVLNH